MIRRQKNRNRKIKIIVGIIAIVIIILLLIKGCNKKEYEVIFKEDKEKTVKVITKEKVERPSDPEKEGYRFVGWYLNGKLYNFEEKVKGNITLEARWEKKEKIEKENYKVEIEYEEGKKTEVELTEGKVVKPSDPEKEGYKFVGWYVNGKLYDFKEKVGSNITIKAKWEKEKGNKRKEEYSKTGKRIDNRAHQKDKTVPEIEEVKVEVKSSRIILKVKARDDRTEVSKLKISYSIDGVNYTTNNIIKNLEQDKEYKVYVKVIDGAGNEVVKEEKVKTKKVEEVRNPVQNITAITNKDVEVRVEESEYELEVSVDNVHFYKQEKNKAKIEENGVYYLRHIDENGNTSSVVPIMIANIDKEKPANFVVNVGKTTRKITVSGTTTDNVTSSANLIYKYSIDGINYVGTKEFDNLRPGRYRVYVKAIDEATNERIEEKEVEIENIPGVEHTLSTTGKTNNNVEITFTNKGNLILQVKENGVWVNKTSPYSVDKNKKVIVRYTDGYNVGSEKEIEITNIDKVAPTVRVNKYEVGYNEIKVEAEVEDNETRKENLRIEYAVDEGSYQTSPVLNNLEVERTYLVKVKVTDEAGNETIKEKGITTLAAPKVGEIRKSTERLTNNNVELIVVDKNPNFKLEYSINNLPFVEYTGGNIQIEDNYKVVFRYVNQNNTAGEEKEVIVSNIDKEQPEITANKESTTEYKKEVEVELKARDNNELKKLEYAVSISSTVEPSTYSRVNGKIKINNVTGKYYIWAKAEDSVGNIRKKVYGPYLLDNKKPEVNLVLDGTTTNKIKLKVVASDPEAGIKGYYYSRDGGQSYSGLQESGIYMYTRLKNDTEYKIRVKVEDKLGNIAESEIKTIRTAPLGNISMTIDDDSWAKKKTLSVTSDQIVGETYSYSLDNGVNWIPITGAISHVEVNKNTIVKYKVSDGVNEDISDIEVTKVDPIKPEITKLEEDVTKTKNGSITFLVEAEDKGLAAEKSGIDKYSYSIDGVNWTADLEPAASYTIDNLKANTTYKVRLRVKDKAGNVEEKSVDIKTKNDCYTINSTGYITGYDFAACPKDLVIPNQINGKNVVGIGTGVFRNKGITSVKFPEGIKDIQSFAFKDNPIVQDELILPASLQTIGNNTFDSSQAEYKKLVLKGNTNIGEAAFSANKIKKLEIPGSVQIGRAAFRLTEIEELDLGNTNTISNEAFLHAKLNQTNIVIPETVTNVQSSAFKSPNIHATNVIFKGDTAIYSNVFDQANIDNLKFEGKAVIGQAAFFNSKVKTVDFGEKTKFIGGSAFQNTAIVQNELKIPASVEKVVNNAFYSSEKKINKLILEAKEVYSNAFRLGKIKEIEISNTQNIGDYAFSNVEVEKLKLSNTIKTLGRGVFNDNRINQNELLIPESIETIGEGLFQTKYGLNIKKLDYKAKAITPMHFARTTYSVNPNKIEEIEISNTKKIGEYSFNYLGTKKITLHEGLETIEFKAFRDNPLVQEELVIPSTVKLVGAESFYSNTKNVNSLKVLNNSEIGDSAFAAGTIKNVDVSNSKVIGVKAFENSGVVNLKISPLIEKIKYRAFAANKLDIEEIVIPNTLNEVEKGIFSRTGKIKNLTWDSSLKIPSEAFLSTRIQNIKITRAEEIENHALYESLFTTVDLGPNMKKIGEFGIGYNEAGTTPTIVIPATMEEMHQKSFWFLRNARIVVKKAEGTILNAPWGAQNNTTVVYEG